MIQPISPPLFSQRDFRNCLAQFATGVCIVTSRDSTGRAVGLTANSFNSVSLSPPLVLWSLSRQAASMEVFSAHSHYVIHILSANQINLAKRFSDKTVKDRFAGLVITEGRGGVPILPGCAAWFECANRSRYEEGDHVIFVGQVEACQYAKEVSGLPLLYHGGRYHPDSDCSPHP